MMSSSSQPEGPSSPAHEWAALVSGSLDVAAAIVDLAGLLIAASPRFYDLVGLSATQSQGQALESLLHEVQPDQAQWLQGWPQQNDFTRLPVHCRRQDGSTWRARISSRRADQFLVVTLLDRLEDDPRPPSHRELELARRLEMVTTAAGVATWSQQPATGDVYWDNQMHRLHGAGQEPLAPGTPAYVQRHVHPDDAAAVLDGLGTLAARKAGLLDLDFRLQMADGRVRRLATRTSIDTTGTEPVLHGVMLDVTDRHASEARLREADERIALASRGAGIGTWEFSLDGERVWWDEQMFRLRGMTPREQPMRRQDALDVVHPDDRESTDRTILSAVEDGATANYEFRVVWPDGTVRWMASRSTSVRDEIGRPLRRIGINWDITDARTTAATQQESLLAQRENQAKSQLLARMSHELRTPLNAVLGFAQLLQADVDQPDPIVTRQRLAHIQSAGDHLLGLINEVLDLSSLESGELKVLLAPVNLAEVVSQTLPLVENLAQHNQIAVTSGAVDFQVMADAGRLRQVLINLLSNAIKYNRPGGEVWLEAEAIDGTVAIRVRDTGRGLSEAQRQHLFEPFNRLGNEHQGIDGTGIGLAIVRAAVEQMGGQVNVTSVVGEGSCFEVRLARARPGPTDPQSKPAVPSAIARDPGGSAVLYIEDNAVNMMIVAELIGRRRDLSFYSAEVGLSGLELARQHRPALILVDMQLPDIDGMEVVRRLRRDALTAGIRCVALSANAVSSDIESALAAGFDAYWTKPMDFGEFLTALDAQFGPAPTP